MFLGSKQSRCPFCANRRRGNATIDKFKIKYIKSKENIEKTLKKFNLDNIKIGKNQFLFSVNYSNSILCIFIFNEYNKNKFNLIFYHTSLDYNNYDIFKIKIFEETYKKIIKFLEKRNNN